MGVLRAKDIMSTGLATTRGDESLDVACTVLALADIRHLPVTDEAGNLIGLVTQRDMIAKFGELEDDDVDASSIRVYDVMTANVKTVGPDDPLLKVAGLLLEYKYGCVPVVDDGKCVGIVTESDFVKMVARQLASPR